MSVKESTFSRVRLQRLFLWLLLHSNPDYRGCRLGSPKLRNQLGNLYSRAIDWCNLFGFIFAKVYQSNAASQTDIYNLESAPMYVGRKAAEVTTSISNYLYASSDSPENLQCFGLKCYQTTFITTGFGFVISALLVMGVYRFNWKPKTGFKLMFKRVRHLFLFYLFYL